MQHFSVLWIDDGPSLVRVHVQVLKENEKRLVAQIYSGFDLVLETAQPISKPEKLTLELIGPDGKPRKDVHLLYPAVVTKCTDNPRVSSDR